MRRFAEHSLHACLLMFAVFCTGSLVRDRSELSVLRSEATRLEKIVGRLEVGNPERMAIVNVTDDFPDEMLWRIYLPAGHPWRTSHHVAGGGGGSNHSSGQHAHVDMFIRCRLVMHQDRWKLFIVHPSGSADVTFQPRVADFMKEHWSELTFEVAAKEGQSEVPMNSIVTLLAIDIPEELMPKVKKELGHYIWNSLQKDPLLIVEIGSEAAFVARENLRQVNASSGTSGSGARGG